MIIFDKQKARKEADALVDALMKRIAGLVETEVEEHLTALEKRLLEQLPQVVHIPPRPVDAPRERLMPVHEIAEVLGCTEDVVKKKMSRGVLTYIVEQGSDERKMPYSWVLEYIHGHTRYTGPFHQRREVPPEEGQGADCAAIVKESRLRRVS